MMKRLGRNESGAVAITVAILLTVFVGFTALAVDIGYFYSVRGQLQSAADAAALAGCQELIKGGSEAEVLAEAEKYAEGDGVTPYNNIAPADGLEMIPAGIVNTDTGNSFTEVTDTYVKVTVKKKATMFFGKIFDALGYKTIMAQSKAKKAYLTGLSNIAPWGVPIVQANRVVAKLESGSEAELVYNGDTKKWEGQLPVNLAARGTGYDVTVIAYNNQTEYPDGTPNGYPNGVPEELLPAASVVVQQPDNRIKNVYLGKNFVTTGEDTGTVDLFVESTETPRVRFNNKPYNSTTVGPNLHKFALEIPNVDTLKEPFAVDVEVGSGNNKYSIGKAAVLVVRRATYPIKDVSLSQAFFTAGSVGSANISVELNSYEYGKEYPLKVDSGGETGNFCALDLTKIYHTPNWKNPHPTEYDLTGNPYYYYLENYFPKVIHIGDTIWTQTGGLSGPQTKSALINRFAGDNTSFDDWEDAGRPSSGRLVYTPILEKIEPATGSTPLRVVSFAAFYIDPSSDLSGNDITIKGRFVYYVAPSDTISDTPPDSNYYMEIPRLVSEGLDF